MLLGLAIPPLLIGHIVGTRLTWTHARPQHRLRARGRPALVERLGHRAPVAAAAHRLGACRAPACTIGCACGSGTTTAEPLAFALALLLPAIALAGFASAGFYLWPSVESVGGMQKYNVDLAGMSDARARSHGGLALRPGMGLLGRARRHAARALAAHAHRRHLPGAPRLRPRDHRAGRPHHPRGDPRRGLAARLGLRRPRALHDLPRARGRRARRTCRRRRAARRRRSAASTRRRTFASPASAARRATSR